MTYNWQKDDWPVFQYDLSAVEDIVLSFAEKVGAVSGIIGTLPENIRSEAIIDMMVSEAIKTSEIEGEYLSRKDVMSSIKNNLGIHPRQEESSDRRAQGIAELMVAVRNTYADPLTAGTLFKNQRRPARSTPVGATMHFSSPAAKITINHAYLWGRSPFSRRVISFLIKFDLS